MPAVDSSFTLRTGLSDFWIRFFADGDQLDALYQGTSVLVGQAYLDYLSAVLGVSLRDALSLDREYYSLITIREDQVAFVEGATLAANRWSFSLPDPVVDVRMLDNKVFEPTASLERGLDYEVASRVASFHQDPTDPTGNGTPPPGYARRTVSAATGGQFTDSAVADWLALAAPVHKGDVVRVLDIGTNGAQRKRGDFTIVLVRTPGLYVNTATPLPQPATGLNYVVLRTPAVPTVVAEAFTLMAGSATLAHTRLDQGSVKVFAKGPTGADVVEGVDYSLNYEAGVITALTAWQGAPGPFAVNYTWKEEVYPAVGTSPRKSTTGVVLSTSAPAPSSPTVIPPPVIASALEVAFWAPDAAVDRRTLANNFGSMIGRTADSSESYREFLRGIFQLYVLGPVISRMESALNVVMNLPVVRDDGEVFQTFDLTDSVMDRAVTLSPITGLMVFYEFPKGTPFRTDLVGGQVLNAFDVFTTAVTVTDYVQTPNWWDTAVIPEALFTPINGVVPNISRRTSSPNYVLNVINPSDGAQIGDPGLMIGTDEVGFNPRTSDSDSDTESPSHPVFRHRMAYVLMDRYLKFHTFQVTFDPVALSALVGATFSQSLQDLNDLVLSARPAHTYPFMTPTTFFTDVITITENPISFDRLVGSRVFGPDEVIFTDSTPTLGAGIWLSGDYFKYELFTVSTAFPVLGTPVTLANAPTAPRHGRLVQAYPQGNVGGVSLVENVDFTVDYANRTITRNTAWASNTVPVIYLQLNIGNVTNAPAGLGDMPILVGGVDPALIHPAYNPSAAGWDGITEPPTAPRDIGMVERALIVSAH